VLIPENQEIFFVMAILGPYQTADQYYPMNDPNIGLNTPLSWHLYLHNRMNQTQSVRVKVKLLNSTLQSPNSSLGIPSPASTVIEITQLLTVNETRIYPFLWQITDIVYTEDSIILNELQINDSYIRANSISTNSNSFRLVFELWLFDEKSQQFEFNRTYLEKSLCVWNQIWFNVTRPL
jgi:hypothetical protein